MRAKGFEIRDFSGGRLAYTPLQPPPPLRRSERRYRICRGRGNGFRIGRNGVFRGGWLLGNPAVEYNFMSHRFFRAYSPSLASCLEYTLCNVCISLAAGLFSRQSLGHVPVWRFGVSHSHQKFEMGKNKFDKI